MELGLASDTDTNTVVCGINPATKHVGRESVRGLLERGQGFLPEARSCIKRVGGKVLNLASEAVEALIPVPREHGPLMRAGTVAVAGFALAAAGAVETSTASAANVPTAELSALGNIQQEATINFRDVRCGPNGTYAIGVDGDTGISDLPNLPVTYDINGNKITVVYPTEINFGGDLPIPAGYLKTPLPGSSLNYDNRVSAAYQVSPGRQNMPEIGVGVPDCTGQNGEPLAMEATSNLQANMSAPVSFDPYATNLVGVLNLNPNSVPPQTGSDYPPNTGPSNPTFPRQTSVKVKRVGGKGKLKADVSPNDKRGNYRFVVQRIDATTGAVIDVGTYSTKGNKDTKTVNPKPGVGTYRVTVLPRTTGAKPTLGSTSKDVYLKK